ncbi:histidine kinase [Paenibacillus alkaliterrae]|uniref:sensor histidine kinase n=1 Tax=Paenibacillus alkaliterrae TaxID=320909 RepID=UPI001F20E7D8|nr:histidine kinase [Paenibacillus alkaliterrae]MCF2938698.1 histidine kinase [Paenibacillus alkaliterrae]
MREKISETYRNTLDIFVRQTDRNLQEINNYLYKMATLDTDVGLLMSSPYGSDNYVLTKVRIQNEINRDIGFYNHLIDTIFLFNESKKSDLIISTSGPYGISQQVLQKNISDIIKSENKLISRNQWLIWKDSILPGEHFAIKTVPVTEGLYVGAIIKMSDIREQLSIQWDDGAIGESGIYKNNGKSLIEPLAGSPPQMTLEQLLVKDEPYRTVTDKTSGQNYMVMSRSSEHADITFNIGIPESNILKGLPYFQKATYFLAFGVILIFAMYLFFIRQIVIKPLQQLIAGMKKISLGMLDMRLKTNETVELVILAKTFNNMAEQIKTLKIGMYEEQLRAQKIELMQLQAQINPHFYMNSLNIIYNFAVLKDYEPVKQMSLHLADYFRFIMRVNRDLISLEEELKHVANYIEIQKLRFPSKLVCEFDLPPESKELMLPALSVQPFIENAVIHGFVNRKQTFRIKVAGSIFAAHEKKYLLLTIEDNGTGFPEGILPGLNGAGPLPQADTSRLGVQNVIQRMNLRYCGEVKISFSNATKGGAVVELLLPLQ